MRTNEKAITRQDIRALIVLLNFPHTILELYDGVCTDSILKKNGLLTDYSYPNMLFVLNKDQQNSYQIDRYKLFLVVIPKLFLHTMKYLRAL